MKLHDGPRVKLPNDAKLRGQMRDWLMSYLTPEAMHLIAQEIVQLRSPELDNIDNQGAAKGPS